MTKESVDRARICRVNRVLNVFFLFFVFLGGKGQGRQMVRFKIV